MSKKINEYQVLQEALLECAQIKYGDTLSCVADWRINTPAMQMSDQLVDRLHNMGFKIIKS